MTAVYAKPTARFSEAIQTANCDLLAQLLDAGADINAVINSYGSTPLLFAIGENRTDCACILIERGAQLGKTAGGVLPLVKAARFGNVEVCRALLDAGAPIDGVDISGRTALLEAVVRDFPAVCGLLLERGADVHLGTKDYLSPMHVAALSSSARASQVVRILVAGGGDPSRLPAPEPQKAAQPMSAFQHAVYRGMIKHVDYFLRECDADPAQTTGDGRTMVDLASTPALKELLRAAIVERTVASSLSTGLASHNQGLRSKSLSPL